MRRIISLVLLTVVFILQIPAPVMAHDALYVQVTWDTKNFRLYGKVVPDEDPGIFENHLEEKNLGLNASDPRKLTFPPVGRGLTRNDGSYSSDDQAVAYKVAGEFVEEFNKMISEMEEKKFGKNPPQWDPNKFDEFVKSVEYYIDHGHNKSIFIGYKQGLVNGAVREPYLAGVDKLTFKDLVDAAEKYRAKGITSDNAIEAVAGEPNWFEKALAFVFKNFLNGLISLLQLERIENLVFSQNQNRFILMDINGWKSLVTNYYSFFAIIAILGYYLVYQNLMLRWGLSTVSPSIRLSIKEDLLTMFFSFFLIPFMLPIINGLLELSGAAAGMFWSEQIDHFINYINPGDGTLAAIFISFAVAGIRIYFNFIYGVIFLSTTYLVMLSPLFCLALNFHSTKKAFEVFVRELASNLVTPVFHAFALSVIVSLINNVSLIFKLIAMASLVPLTDMLKMALIGSFSPVASRFGTAAMAGLVGAAMGMAQNYFKPGGAGKVTPKVEASKNHSLVEDPVLNAAINRTNKSEIENSEREVEAGLKEESPLSRGSLPLPATNGLRGQIFTSGSGLRKAVKTGITTGLGLAGATMGAAVLGPAGAGVGGVMAAGIGNRINNALSGKFDHTSPDYLAKTYGVKGISYNPDGSAEVQWDADYIHENYGITGVYRGQNGVTYEFDMDKWSGVQQKELTNLYEEWDKKVNRYKNPEGARATQARESFAEKYGISNIVKDPTTNRMQVTYTNAHLQKQGILDGYMRNPGTFVETYSRNSLPMVGPKNRDFNLDNAPRWGIGR